MKRHLLSLSDLTKLEAETILDIALKFKHMDRYKMLEMCKGKAAAVIFEKPSTRTRISLEVALSSIGATPIILSSSEMQLSRGESLRDTARVLSRYVDAIAARVFSHDTLIGIAKDATVTVINALSDKFHPLQGLADVMTIIEQKGSLDGLRLAYLGDGNNVANTLIQAAAIFGFEIVVSTPRGYEPSDEVIECAKSIAGDKFKYCWEEEPFKAVLEADVVYTDTWVSMGSETEEERRKEVFKNWQVDNAKMSKARRDAIFMHCLPAHKGEEVTEEVFESEKSVVFDQAENRLHTASAVFFYLWKGVRL